MMMLATEYVVRTANTLLMHFREYALLVLNPRSRYRSHVIARLMEDAPCPIYYYSLGVADSELLHFLRLFVHALQEQQPAFGYHTGKLLWDNAVEPQSVIDALVQDLSTLDEADYILVLDEYDLIVGCPDIHSLIGHLVMQLPPHCHLLINSRTMPPFAWTSLIARNQAAVVDGDSLSSGIERTGTFAGQA